jgi:ribonuclease G
VTVICLLIFLEIVRKSILKQLIINYITREKRFALLHNQKVEKLQIKQPKQTSLVGNVYLGIVTKVLPGMNAAFVDYGGEKNGFIHRDELASFVLSEERKEEKERKSISSFAHQGERLIVQVEKDETGTKGARLTGIVELSGRNLVYMPKGKYVAVSKKIEQDQARENWRQFGYRIKTTEEGFIFRTSCELSSEEEIQREAMELRQLSSEIETKAKSVKKPGLLFETDHYMNDILEVIKPISHEVQVIADDRELIEKLKGFYPEATFSLYREKENIFSYYHLDGEVEKALKRIVWLSNGAYLVIDEVEALTIIDVNTGKFSGKQSLADTVFKTNLLAAEESARQIRLRDLAGMILIDFIDMKRESERNDIIRAMEKELQKDGRQTKIIGFTSLGILQLTRKKTKVSLSESLLERCSVCEGTGKILSTESAAFHLERELYEYRYRDLEKVVVECTENVQRVFCGEQQIHQKQLEEILGFIIQFEIQDGEKPYYHIKQFY